MKIRLLIIISLLSFSAFSQTVIRSVVKDSKTKEPLAFCNISVKGSWKGTISNGDGEFIINTNGLNDTLLFSYLGYKPLEISADKVRDVVFMDAVQYSISEIIVSDNNEYLYNILEKCRKMLLQYKYPNESKVYYGLSTKTQEYPLELLEIYYNAHTTGINVDEMMFKNGRVGLTAVDNYFISLNTSRAVSRINLTEDEKYFPSIPLQFRKNNMKKYFNLELLNADDQYYQIKFSPTSVERTCFSGTAWIDRNNFNLLKIEMFYENTPVHPFLPLFKFDTIDNVSVRISNTYKLLNNQLVPDNFNFNYSFSYLSHRSKKQTVEIEKVITREISTSGVIYFYDYSQPFILPYFDYDNNFDDYRKMSFIPYNEKFWESNNTMLLTDKQKEDLGFFAKSGKLINYKSGNYGANFLNIQIVKGEKTPFFEFYYSFWNQEKRIRLSEEMIPVKSPSGFITQDNIPNDLYKLKVQIMLDINQINDSLFFKTYTVFDTYQTYYSLARTATTDPFINIFFDLCEIERRNLDARLKLAGNNIVEFERIYKDAISVMDEITARYCRDVNHGKNFTEFQKWNKYVSDRLGVDNIRIFGEADK